MICLLIKTTITTPATIVTATATGISKEYHYHSPSHTLTTYTTYSQDYNSNSNHDNRKNHTIITMPLLPHATVQERFRKQRLLLLNNDPNEQQQQTVDTKIPRPPHSKYHYQRILQDTSLYSRQEIVAASQALQIAGLFQGYGTHYADLWCGSPTPQRQTVIVDTGSGVTAFPCNECDHNCGVPDYHIDDLFDETKSGTFTKLTCTECLRGDCDSSSDTCTFGMSYQEGSSWNAFEVSDLCYVGGFHDRPTQEDQDNTKQSIDTADIDPFHAPAFAFRMKFGCQTRITGLFITQLADGIMGMDVAQPALWYQMYNANKIQHKAFSLCFSRKNDADRAGTEAGAMSLGGTDERLHNTPLVYTTTTEGSGFYVVHIRKMYLRQGGGGLSSLSTKADIQILQLNLDEDALNAGRVIVDSGTTDTYFSRRIKSAFEDVYRQLTGVGYDHGVKHFTKEELAQQPTILFQISGDEALNQAALDASTKGHVVGLAGDLDKDHPLDVILAVPPEHYYEYDDEEGGYVSRFYDSEGSGGVIGANAMMGHDVYFDVENDRIGWSESDCDYTELVKQYTDGDWVPATPEPIDDPSRVEPSNGDDDNKGDGPNDTHDEPSGNYKSPVDTKVCNGLSCQISVLVGVVAIISLVAFRVMRRVPSGPSYEIADSELELRNVSAVSDIEDHDEFVNHRRRAEFT